MNAPWKDFHKETLTKIFTEKKNILDIGGGLRLKSGQGNIYSKDNGFLFPYLKDVTYKIMDPVDTYQPDIVGDIHKMPFGNNELDAIVCSSVLEHIEDPIRAAKELFRVLKPGGYCYVYVPFLYYYHAEKGYYGDYWRFTEEAIRFMFRDFSRIEIQQVRGALETWLHISPLGKIKLIALTARVLDKLTGKDNSKQTSGYYVFLLK